MITRKITKEGYIALKIGSKWIEEHRKVAQDVLKRDLTPSETIHHKDFNRQNNNPTNLVLFENQKAHAHFHRQFQQFGLTNPLRRILESNKILSLNKK